MEHQKILILDFGGQYNQLIARRVREQNVYCDLLPYDMTVEKIREYDPIGIIFTGGPNSVYADNAPNVKKEIFDLGIPVLEVTFHRRNGRRHHTPTHFGGFIRSCLDLIHNH